MCCPNLESRARDLLIAVVNNTLVFGFVNVILLLYCIVSGNDDSFSIANLRILVFVVWRFAFLQDLSVQFFWCPPCGVVEKKDKDLFFEMLKVLISVTTKSFTDSFLSTVGSVYANAQCGGLLWFTFDWTLSHSFFYLGFYLFLCHCFDNYRFGWIFIVRRIVRIFLHRRWLIGVVQIFVFVSSSKQLSYDFPQLRMWNSFLLLLLLLLVPVLVIMDVGVFGWQQHSVSSVLVISLSGSYFSSFSNQNPHQFLFS